MFKSRTLYFSYPSLSNQEVLDALPECVRGFTANLSLQIAKLKAKIFKILIYFMNTQKCHVTVITKDLEL